MSRVEYVPYEKTVTVTEKRASTDDSIRIFDEMEQKALKHLMSRDKLEFNGIKLIAYFFNHMVMSNELDYKLKVNINGKEYLFEGVTNQRDYMEFQSVLGGGYSKGKIVEKFFKHISDIIAKTLLIQMQEQYNTIK